MAGTAVLGRLTWLVTEVAAVQETPRVRTLLLDAEGWPGHRPGQHLDVRLTAEDGYQAERSYSIASSPGEPLAITVERLENGEVSPYLVEEARDGDGFEVRGPIGGYFVWEDDGPAGLPRRRRLRSRAADGNDPLVRRVDADPVALLVEDARGRDLPPGARDARRSRSSKL